MKAALAAAGWFSLLIGLFQQALSRRKGPGNQRGLAAPALNIILGIVSGDSGDDRRARHHGQENQRNQNVVHPLIPQRK